MTSHQSSVNLTYCGACGLLYPSGTFHSCTTEGSPVIYMSFPIEPSLLELRVLELLDRLEKAEKKLDELEQMVIRKRLE